MNMQEEHFMIDRFTQKAREAIRLAVETAEELEHGYVGTCLLYTSIGRLLCPADSALKLPMDKYSF